MATRRAGDPRIHPGWWTLILVAVIVGITVLTTVFFLGAWKSSVPITLTSDRAGLVMETGAKVKLRGVQVGTVAQISGGTEPVSSPCRSTPIKSATSRPTSGPASGRRPRSGRNTST